VDFNYLTGHHNIKVGGTITATKLHEAFSLGITDPTDAAFAGDDGAFNPALAPFDLTNGGSPLLYDQSFTIKQQAAYVQDEIAAGPATFKLGLRLDHYDGLVSSTQAEPRLGVSYAVPHSGTLLRASYGRTMETPYNENLLLSGGYGLNGLFGTSNFVPVGKRNEVELGIQQAFGGWVVADFGYFNKHTDNAYDFGVLFDTPITFRSRGTTRASTVYGPPELRRAPRLQRVRGDGPHERDLLAAGRGRHSRRRSVGDFRIDRSEVQRHDERAVHVRQALRAWAD
jgi:hypothetical protein